MVGQSFVTYLSQDWNEADHEPLKNITSKLSFPCLRARALQRAGVKTGIQDAEKENWIPAGVYPEENRGRNDGQKDENG